MAILKCTSQWHLVHSQCCASLLINIECFETECEEIRNEKYLTIEKKQEKGNKKQKSERGIGMIAVFFD